MVCSSLNQTSEVLLVEMQIRINVNVICNIPMHFCPAVLFNP